MACQINRSTDGTISQVFAPDGVSPSILYSDILDTIDITAYVYDSFAKSVIDKGLAIMHEHKRELKKELALIEWARMYDKFGTDINGNDYDINGEIKLHRTQPVHYLDLETDEMKTIEKAKALKQYLFPGRMPHPHVRHAGEVMAKEYFETQEPKFVAQLAALEANKNVYLEGFVRIEDSRFILRKIKNSRTIPAQYTLLASRLESFPFNLPTVHTYNTIRAKQGFFSYKADGYYDVRGRIYMSSELSEEQFYITFLHEMLHFATHMALDNENSAFYKEINSLYERTKSEMKYSPISNARPELSTIHEFVAYGMTSKTFQEELLSIRYEDSNLFERAVTLMWNVLRQMLGIVDGYNDNVLKSLILHTNEYLINKRFSDHDSFQLWLDTGKNINDSATVLKLSGAYFDTKKFSKLKMFLDYEPYYAPLKPKQTALVNNLKKLVAEREKLIDKATDVILKDLQKELGVTYSSNTVEEYKTLIAEALDPIKYSLDLENLFNVIAPHIGWSIWYVIASKANDILESNSARILDVQGDLERIENPPTKSNLMLKVKQPNSPLSIAANKLSRLFNLPIHVIDEFAAKELLSSHGKTLAKNNNAFFINGEVYLIEGRADMQTLVHEVAHPFIEYIYQNNRELYNRLKEQLSPELIEQAKKDVVDKEDMNDVYKEAMAIYIGNLNNDQGILDRIWSYLKGMLSAMLGRKVTLNENTTLEDIYELISDAKQSFDLGGITAELNKIYFETREDSEHFKQVKERATHVTPKPDKTAYTKGGSTYTPVNSVVDTFTGKKKVDGDLAEYIADKIWKDRGILPSVELVTQDFPEALNKAAFIRRKKQQLEYAIKKGTIMHKLREWYFAKDIGVKGALKDEIMSLGQSIGIADAMEFFGWSVMNTEANQLFAKILAVEGVNMLDDTVPEALKDKVANEVKVYSDTLGWAGTIDSFYEHFDGTFSIIDMFTGSSYNKVIVDKLMEYGGQALAIEDSVKNRKKLQIMLYAFILKTEIPDIKFKNLKVHWMKNDYTAVLKTTNSDVDVTSFLNMIEAYLIAEKPDVYAKVKTKSYNAFDPNEYYSTPTSILQEEGSIEQTIEALQIRLTNLNNAQQDFRNRNKKNSVGLEKEIRITTEKLASARSSGMGNILDTSRADETMWKVAFGQFGDFADKKLQNFKLFMDGRRFKAEKEKAEVKRKLGSITTQLRQEYLSRTGKNILSTLTLGQIDTLMYKDLYGKLLVPKSISDDVILEELITKDHPDYNTKLTQTERDFVNFISTTMRQYNEIVLNKVAFYDHNNKPVTFLQLLKNTRVDFKFEDASFLPRLPMLDDELREAGGVISEDHFKKLKRRIKERYLISANKEQDEYGIPLKYYGNMELIASNSWSRNLEHAFLGFTENLIDKIYMDDVIAYGKGIITLYNADVAADGKPEHMNNAEFLERRILLDIMGRKDTADVSRTGVRIAGAEKKLNIIAIIGAIRRFTSKQIMWLKPFQGAANGVMAKMITLRRAAVTSITKEGAFGFKDTLRASVEMQSYTKDMMLRNLDNNKIALMLQEFDYLPNDFGYNTPSSDLVTSKNKGLNEGNMYLFHTMFEKANAINIMVAQLIHMKTTKNGEEISMFDAYDVIQEQDPITGRTYSKLKYTGDVRGASINAAGEPEVLAEVTSNEVTKMKRVYQQMQGGYRADEKSTIELYWWGQILVQFRKYLPAIVMQALKSKNEDYTLGHYKQLFNGDGSPKLKDGQKMYQWVAEETEGSLRIIFASFVNLITFGKFYKDYSVKAMKEAGQHEKVRVLYESMITAATFIMIYAALMQLFPDDDDEKDETKLLLHRIAENYSQHYNPVDWLRTMKSPPAAVAKFWLTMSAGAQMIAATSYVAFGDEDKAYTRYGRLKGGTEMMKSIPVLSAVYSFHKFIGKSEWSEDSAISDWFTENIDLAR